jgi:hypothetical protein
LRAAEELGWRSGPATAYASSPSNERVSFAQVGDYGMLKFHFPVGSEAYRELTGKPGLTASIVLDRSTREFLGVRFKHRRES